MFLLKKANKDLEKRISDEFSKLKNIFYSDFKKLSDEYLIVFGDVVGYGGIYFYNEAKRGIIDTDTYSEYLEKIFIDRKSRGYQGYEEGWVEKTLSKDEVIINYFTFSTDHYNLIIERVEFIEDLLKKKFLENNNSEELINFLNKAKSIYGEKSDFYQYLLSIAREETLIPINYDLILDNLQKYFSKYLKRILEYEKILNFSFKNISNKKILCLNTNKEYFETSFKRNDQNTFGNFKSVIEKKEGDGDGESIENSILFFKELRKLNNSRSLLDSINEAGFESEDNLLKALESYYKVIMSIGEKKVGGRYLHYYGDVSDYKIPKDFRLPTSDRYSSLYGQSYSERPKTKDESKVYNEGFEKFFKLYSRQLKEIVDFALSHDNFRISLNMKKYDDILDENNKVVSEYVKNREEEFNSKKSELKKSLPEEFHNEVLKKELKTKEFKIQDFLDKSNHDISIYFSSEENKDNEGKQESEKNNKSISGAKSMALENFLEEVFSMSYYNNPRKESLNQEEEITQAFWHYDGRKNSTNQVSQTGSYSVNIFDQIYNQTERTSFLELQKKVELALNNIFETWSDEFNKKIPSKQLNDVIRYNYPGVNIDLDKDEFFKVLYDDYETSFYFRHLSSFLNKDADFFLKSLTEKHLTHSVLDNLESSKSSRDETGSHNIKFLEKIIQKISESSDIDNEKKQSLIKKIKQHEIDIDSFLSENFESGQNDKFGKSKKPLSDYVDNNNIYKSIVDLFKKHLKEKFEENYLSDYILKDNKIDYIDLIKRLDLEVCEKIKKVNNLDDLKNLFENTKNQYNIYTYLDKLNSSAEAAFFRYTNKYDFNNTNQNLTLDNLKELFDLESENKDSFFDDNNLIDIITSFDNFSNTKTEEDYSIYKRNVFLERYRFYETSGFLNLRNYHKEEDKDVYFFISDEKYAGRKIRSFYRKLMQQAGLVGSQFDYFLQKFFDYIAKLNKEVSTKEKNYLISLGQNSLTEVLGFDISKTIAYKKLSKVFSGGMISFIYFITEQNEEDIEYIFKYNFPNSSFDRSQYKTLSGMVKDFFTKDEEDDPNLFAKKGDERRFFCIKDKDWIYKKKNDEDQSASYYTSNDSKSFVNASMLLAKLDSEDQIDSIVENINVFNNSLNEVVGELIKSEESFLSSKIENRKLIFDFIKDPAVKKFAILMKRGGLRVESMESQNDFDDMEEFEGIEGGGNNNVQENKGWDNHYIENRLYNNHRYGMLSYNLIRYIENISFMEMLCFFVIGQKEDYSTKQKLCNFLLKNHKILNLKQGITSDFDFARVSQFTNSNFYLHKFITECVKNSTGSYLQRVNKAIELKSIYHNSIPESEYRNGSSSRNTYGEKSEYVLEEKHKGGDTLLKDIEFIYSDECEEKDHVNLDVVRRLFKTFFSIKNLKSSSDDDDEYSQGYYAKKDFDVDINQFIIIYIFEKFFPEEIKERYLDLSRNGSYNEKLLYENFTSTSFYSSLIPVDTFYIILGLMPFELIKPNKSSENSDSEIDADNVYNIQLENYLKEKTIYEEKKKKIDNYIIQIVNEIKNYYSAKENERYTNFKDYRDDYLDGDWRFSDEEDYKAVYGRIDWQDKPIIGNIKAISWKEASEIKLPEEVSNSLSVFSSLKEFFNFFKLNYKDIHSDHERILNINKYSKKVQYIASVISGLENLKKYHSMVTKKVPQLFDLNFRYKIKTGNSIGDYRFRVLEDLDPYHFQVGADTNCCQQIGLAGAVCAIDSFVNSEAGVVLLERMEGESANLISQSYFHYLPKENYIILDNVEFTATTNRLSPHYAILAEYLLSKGYKKVLCGKNYTKGDLLDGKFITNSEAHSDRKFVMGGYNDYSSGNSLDLGRPQFKIPNHVVNSEDLEDINITELESVNIESLKEADDVLENNSLLLKGFEEKKKIAEGGLEDLRYKLDSYDNIGSAKNIHSCLYYKIEKINSKVFEYIASSSDFRKYRSSDINNHIYDEGNIITFQDLLKLITFLDDFKLYEIEWDDEIKKDGYSEIKITKALPTSKLYNYVLRKIKGIDIKNIDLSIDIRPVEEKKHYLTEMLTSKYKKYELNSKRILKFLKKKLEFKIKEKQKEIEIIDNSIQYIVNQNSIIDNKSQGFLLDPKSVCDIYFAYIDRIEDVENKIYISEKKIQNYEYSIENMERDIVQHQNVIKEHSENERQSNTTFRLVRNSRSVIKTLQREIEEHRMNLNHEKNLLSIEKNTLALYKEKNSNFLIYFNEENKELLASEFFRRKSEINLKIKKENEEIQEKESFIAKLNEELSNASKEKDSNSKIIKIIKDEIQNIESKFYIIKERISVLNQEIEELERFKSIMFEDLESKIQKSSFINNLIIKRAAGVDNYFRLLELSKWLASKNLYKSNIIDLLY